MEGFFKLISNFQAPSELAYCGLASLSMALNALSIDPGRTWKGPWRWFDESMLDYCEPLEKVKSKGISFGKLTCLAHCAGANVQAFRTTESSISEFRNYVKTCSLSDECQSFHPTTESCKHDSWASIAKYLMEGAPLLLKSENVKDIEKAISVVCMSLPSNFKYFIKWVVEVQRDEDSGQSLSQEEMKRHALKEELLKQVRETDLYKQVNKFLSTAYMCSSKGIMLGHENNLSDVAAAVCCEGVESLTGQLGSGGGFCCEKSCVKQIRSDGSKPITSISGTVKDDSNIAPATSTHSSQKISR